MDQGSQEINDEQILALSWNIATDPKLYRELAINPYSPKSQQIISERFPDASISDCIRAIVLAEPEGNYDRHVRSLSTKLGEEELQKQQQRVVKLHKKLLHYGKKQKKELRRLPKDVVYEMLSLIVFETADVKEIEQKYAQVSRRNLRLAIVNFIERTHTHGVFKKKFTRKRQLLLVAFTLPFLMLLLYVAQKQIHSTSQQTQIKKQISAGEVHDKNQGFPMRLQIPVINVNAAVEYVGITPKGAMDVPINTVDVGLFKFGTYPGENGNAVIAGHYDGKTGNPGVFASLDKLKKGDKVYINYANGISLTFIVRESRMYNPGYAKDVFSGNNGAHLNLITCDGVWDAGKKSYSKRLVIFTDITH